MSEGFDMPHLWDDDGVDPAPLPVVRRDAFLHSWSYITMYPVRRKRRVSDDYHLLSSEEHVEAWLRWQKIGMSFYVAALITLLLSACALVLTGHAVLGYVLFVPVYALLFAPAWSMRHFRVQDANPRNPCPTRLSKENA